MSKIKNPLILIIMDGFGIGDKTESNAISKASTPNLDKIFSENPLTFLSASGQDVGLPEGQMGNSEVGHTNIGAGRIIYQELTRISRCIKDESFFKNPEIIDIMEQTKLSNGRLHIGGLLSDGGVHSHISHLYALLKMAKNLGLSEVGIHIWLDGRDVSPYSGVNYIKDCEKELNNLKIGKIETICGRYYSMDRDNRWERILKAYNAMANAKGKIFSDPKSFVKNSYNDKLTDEFIIPGVREGYKGINNNDSFICFNFRPDRARQITKAFCDMENENLKNIFKCRKVYPKKYLCFTQYDRSIKGTQIAFKPEEIKNTLGECISNKGFNQLRIAETEKYAHVTFFFNGGNEKPFNGEERILIPSPNVATYDLKPEMSAYEITDKVIEKMEKDQPELIILNYANCDMVGHTGIMKATICAVETVDECVGKLISAIKKFKYVGIITADHGNAEKMIDSDGTPFTAHTSNPVPFCVMNYKCNLKSKGKLADIAPTVLEIMNIKKPIEMSGESLLKENNLR